MRTPQTLIEAVKQFSDLDAAHAYFRDLRWPDGKIPCPQCGKTDLWFLANQRRWKCKGCGKQFSVKVGTIFEDSPLGLDRWLTAVWLVVNAKNGISSCEIARALGVTQKSAWFMAHRIRLALKAGSFEKLQGYVEADESFIGGKSQNMHRDKRERVITSRAPGTGKSAVFGILERGGNVVTFHVQDTKLRTLEPKIIAHIEEGSKISTDKHRSYQYLNQWFQHGWVDHVETYVQGLIHTNGLENYWSLLKRTIKGTYVSVEPFHLSRYLDEQAYRFNLRGLNDGQRFSIATGQVSGRRITYRQLIGKELAAGA